MGNRWARPDIKNYSILSYGEMLADRTRVEAYLQALRNSIKKTSVVVEIGTGLGTFAIEAAKLGAAEVIAIDPDESIQVAQQLAASNGFSDRIKFIRHFSTAVDLPRQADVIISDLRGVLPLFQQHIPSIIDARQRLLKPGGILIPKSDTLWAVPVEAPALYRNVSLWDEVSNEIKFDLAQRIIANTWWRGQAEPSQFLSTPQSWAELDYLHISEPDVKAEIVFGVERPGTMHGWSMWFDTLLDDEAGFSNHPAQPEITYGNAFFPLEEPIALLASDSVQLNIRADLLEDDYVYSWHTRAFTREGTTKAEYRQSTFFGVPRTRETLQKQNSEYKSSLSRRGQLQCYILSLMDGSRTNEQIARAVMEEFPGAFANLDKALFSVTTVSRKYAK